MFSDTHGYLDPRIPELFAGVDHIRHTHDPSRNLFSRGLPAHGAEFADDLERLVAQQEADHALQAGVQRVGLDVVHQAVQATVADRPTSL